MGSPRFELGSPALPGELSLTQGKRVEGETAGVSPPEAGRMTWLPYDPTISVICFSILSSSGSASTTLL